MHLNIAFGACSVLLLAAGVFGAGLGFAEDLDSLALAHAIEVIQQGGYARSRVYGAPLYEFTAATVHALGGLIAVNLASMAAMLAGCFFLWRTMRIAGGPAAPAALVAAFAQPIILINASVLMETALLTLWVCAALLAAVKAAHTRSWAWIWAAAAAASLGVATRPDAALFALAVGGALALDARPDARRIWAVLAIFALQGIAALSTYAVLNGGFSVFLEAPPTTDSAARSTIRAAFGFLALLSVPGAIAAAVVAVVLIWRPSERLRALRAAPPPKRLLAWVAAISATLYFARFVTLPDELEYLVAPAMAAFAALGAIAPRAPVAALASCMLAANLLQVAIFERDAHGLRLASPRLQPGALLQDWATRRHNLWLRNPETLTALAKVAGAQHAELDRSYLWLSGVAFQDGAVIMGEDQFYRFAQTQDPQNPHHLGRYERVTVCKLPLVPRRGWRILQPLDARPSHPARLREACRQLTRPDRLDVAFSGAGD